MSISSRRRQRFSTGAILLATFFGVPSASHAVQLAPTAATYDECRVLVEMQVYNQAIQRCEEAVRLDPKSPDPFFQLGRGYYFLALQLPPTTPADVTREHRRKAAENFKKFLVLNRGDTAWRNRVTPLALAAVLTIYVFEEETDEAALEYANRLAEEPALERNELLLLAKVYSRHARPELSEKTLKRQLQADPSDAEVCQDLAVLYNEPVWNGRSRFDDSIGTFERCAKQSPDDPAVHLRLATFLWDKAYQDKGLADQQKLAYVERGLTHINRALALKGDLLEAIVYKGLLLRVKAMVVSDPPLQQQLLDEAGALQQRARALKAAGVVGGGPPDAPPPPPPPTAIRVGGEIKEPTKLKDVRPEYPGIAQQSRVQGVVILEATIGPDGTVVDVKVLRSIPLLDAAAIAAVRQWIYVPTTLNEVPVAVIMTVTVNFTLS